MRPKGKKMVVGGKSPGSNRMVSRASAKSGGSKPKGAGVDYKNKGAINRRGKSVTSEYVEPDYYVRPPKQPYSVDVHTSYVPKPTIDRAVPMDSQMRHRKF